MKSSECVDTQRTVDKEDKEEEMFKSAREEWQIFLHVDVIQNQCLETLECHGSWHNNKTENKANIMK